jgi:hypothetical protein
MQEEKKESIKEHIDSIFNFNQAIEENSTSAIGTKIQTFEEKTKELALIDKKDIQTIEDKDYLIVVLKHMVEIGMRAIEKLESNIKIGSKVGEGDDFASAFQSLTEAVSKLADLQFKLFDLNMIQNPPTPPPSTNIQNNFFGESSSSELLDLLDNMSKNAKANNSMNGVEAKFRIDVEKP